MVLPPILLLLLMIMGFPLLGLLWWGFKRARTRPTGAALLDTDNHLQLGFLIFAAFSSGLFIAYILIALLPGGR